MLNDSNLDSKKNVTGRFLGGLIPTTFLSLVDPGMPDIIIPTTFSLIFFLAHKFSKSGFDADTNYAELPIAKANFEYAYNKTRERIHASFILLSGMCLAPAVEKFVVPYLPGVLNFLVDKLIS